MNNIYETKAKSLSGEELHFSDYKNKVLLIVNTASKCGFTPQLTGLQDLHEKHFENGLNILGFPCDQFGHQEPGSDYDISQGCVLSYALSFQMFSKIEVNGKNAHPLFNYLKGKKGGLFGKRIKWNFTKFLVDQKGNVIKRYGPTATPEKIEEDILNLL
jgi:glutathione peroxidase